MAFHSFQKPVRGSALLASRERSADRRAAEQKEMQAALKRDQRKCRWPACEFVGKKLPIDPCHVRHRGMGGNAKLDRTTQDAVWAACRAHHGQYDAGLIDIEPLTDRGCDGVLAFYAKDPESGAMMHVASETRIGVSVPRS